MLSVLLLTVSGLAFGAEPDFLKLRLSELVQAIEIGTHAHQVELRHDDCLSSIGLDKAQLRALVATQHKLLTSDVAPVRAWLKDKKAEKPASVRTLIKAWLPLWMGAKTPVRRIGAELRARAPGKFTESVASLFQLALEADRDADRLQELIRFYRALGLPTYTGQLGLSGADEELLYLGQSVEAKTCKAAYATNAQAWQIAGRKLWNWSERIHGLRDAKTLANEILAEPNLSVLSERVGSSAPKKIIVIGHSFTSPLHWASPSTFVPIVREILQTRASRITVDQIVEGGMDATTAYRKYFDQVAAARPNRVYLAVTTRGQNDAASVARFAREFQARGIELALFDAAEIHDPYTRDPSWAKRAVQAARAEGAIIVPLEAALTDAFGIDRASQLSLDGVHMKEDYHRVLAREWLHEIAGQPLLFIGDSHTVGPFGQKLDSLLRGLARWTVNTVGACGTSPAEWLLARESLCGYFERSYDGTVELTDSPHATPKWNELLARLKPARTIVALGTNRIDAPDTQLEPDLRRMISAIRASGSECVWIGPPHMRVYSRDQIENFYRMMERIRSDLPCKIVRSHDLTQYPLHIGDGIHYNGSMGALGRELAEKWARDVFAEISR